MSEKTQLVLVETVSQFRIRYLVEVPTGDYIINDQVRPRSEWALDTVTMNEAQEFSQLHLGETIVSHRVVTDEEAMQICRTDNDYISSWQDDTVREKFWTAYQA